MTVLEFDWFTQQGIGYTGAIKLRTEESDFGCCGCNSLDSSVIVFYSNGSAIDLWTCQGCQCLQKPVGPIELPDGIPVALHPGATVPEEVCSSCCYERTIPDGEGGFMGAWAESKPIGLAKLDLLQAGLVNAELMKELSIASKLLEARKPVIIEEILIVDPFDVYLKSLEAGC